MSEDFEKGKAFLKKSGNDGKNLYDHLAMVLLEVVKEKPSDAFASFEQLSMKVKNGAADPSYAKEIPTLAAESAERKRALASIRKTSDLIKPPLAEGEEAKEPVLIPDLMANSRILSQAGIEFGEEEMYKLTLSIQALATEKDLEDVRFFGRISGTKRDYYIVEAKCKEWPENKESEDPKVKPEDWGTGPNEYGYFVANSAEGTWTMLPQLLPQWLVTAKSMRRFFSGDLNAPVLGFPRFPANEACYLRTQIARIVSNTVIAPKGRFVKDEDAGDDADVVKMDEEWEALPPPDLMTPDNWEHIRCFLLKIGRSTNIPKPEGGDEEEGGEAKEDEEEQEEVKPKLTPIAEDTHGLPPIMKDEEKTGSWTFRVSPAENNPYAVVSALSLAWPGAVAAAQGKNFVNIYVGNGVNYLPGVYSPPPPPAMQAEFVAKFDAEAEEKDPMEEQKDVVPANAGKKDDEDDEDDDDDGDEGGEDGAEDE